MALSSSIMFLLLSYPFLTRALWVMPKVNLYVQYCKNELDIETSTRTGAFVQQTPGTNRYGTRLTHARHSSPKLSSSIASSLSIRLLNIT